MRASNIAVFESCLERTGPLLGHIDTISAARDIEALRIGLRDGKLNYIGWSYGTQLGSQYAELYPKSIRAMVLDGNVDHSQPEVSALVTEGFDLRRRARPVLPVLRDHALLRAARQGRRRAVRRAGAQGRRQPHTGPGLPARQREPCRRPLQNDRERRRHPVQHPAQAGLPKGWPALDLLGWDALGQAIDDALNRDDATFFSTAKAVDDKFEFFQVRGVECMDWTTDSSRTFADLQSKIVLGRAITPHTDFASQTYDIQTSCLGWGLSPKGHPGRWSSKAPPPIPPGQLNSRPRGFRRVGSRIEGAGCPVRCWHCVRATGICPTS